MKTQDIISELSKLSRPELEKVDACLHELLDGGSGAPAKTWSEALREVAGTAEGLPADFAQNHDRYLHGTPHP